MSESTLRAGATLPYDFWEDKSGFLPLTYSCKGCEEEKATWDSFSDTQKKYVLHRRSKGARCIPCCEKQLQKAALQVATNALDKAAKEADKETCRKGYECHLCRGYNKYNEKHGFGPYPRKRTRTLPLTSILGFLAVLALALTAIKFS